MSNSKIATIVPLAHLNEIEDDDYFMALSYAIDNKDYAGFFAERAGEGKYVILDNSAVELGSPEPFGDYLDKAITIHASEIMLPDVFQDPQETYQRAKAAISKMRRQRRFFNVMVIPQGETIEDWYFNAIGLISLVDPFCKWMHTKLCLGVSTRYTDMFGGSRSAALIFDFGEIPIHLLGCYANPILEIRPILDFVRVRGVDSSYPSIFAKNDMILSAETMAMPRPMTQLDLINDVYDFELLRSNIKVWQEACRPVV